MTNKPRLITEQWGLPPEDEDIARQAVFYSKAKGMIPDSFLNSPASIYVAIKKANAMQCEILEVLNGLFMLHGKPGWYTEFLIKQLRRKGIKISYEVERKGKNIAVTAIAIEKDATKNIGTTVTLEMAEAEGWTRNKKYTTMPEYMLKKRAATFLINEYYPDVKGGIATIDELEDRNVNPIRIEKTKEDELESLLPN